MKTSFSRSFLAISLFLVAALLLIGVTFRLLARNYLQDRAMEDLRTDASVLSHLAQAAYDGRGLNNHDFIVSMSVSKLVSGNDAVIFDQNGRLSMCAAAPFGCTHQGMSIGDEFLRQIREQGYLEDTCVLTGLYPEVRYVVAAPIHAPGSGTFIGAVVTSEPIAATMGILNRITEIFLFVTVLVALLMVIIMTLFVRRQNAPLKELANAARAFGHGDLNARVEVDDAASVEMRELALAFNNMASSLQKSEYQRQEFVANVSHELKTPMTTIAGYVDGILDGTIPPEKQKNYLQVVSDETKRLNRLVRSMLDISRLQDEGGIPEEQKIHFDLCDCAGQVLITFERPIISKKLDVQVEFPPHPSFTIAHRDYITQVIYNLVDNAVKFCPEGGVLELKIAEGGGKVYVSVANDGPTIPPEELPLVFDRFHKTDKSRARNRDGWGLGLYIVKTIVCAHGEDISVASRDGRTTFTFTMPRAN